ncbi:MAG: sulfotransferase family 2 domain-containing protein [Pseudomonadota bacterium]
MISHFHKTIFVHIPKCGGMTVEHAFLEDIGLDWNRRAPFLLLKNIQPRIGPERLAHLTAAEYLKYKYCTPEHFASYYKFSVVRDPIARIVSVYNYTYLKRFSKPFRAFYMAFEKVTGVHYPFDAFMSRVVEPALTDTAQQVFGDDAFYNGFYWFLRPQVDFIYDGEKQLVDDVVRLESLKNEWPKIANRTGVQKELGHVNSSLKRLSVTDLSDAQQDRIRSLYAADYDMLDRIGG